jgi:hypothetical protein
MATGIAETHPLILAQQIHTWSWFNDIHDVAQIAGILSCFANVKVREQVRRCRPQSEDSLVQRHVQELIVAFHDYCTLEDDQAGLMLTQIEDLQFDLIDWIMRWFRCSDELACRVFLIELQDTLGVSVGDFTKAVLKISTVVKELSAIAETHGQVECLHKLSTIDTCMLKYVATSQSLYV